MSARARSRVTLRKMLVQFSELVFFVALECQICAAFAKVQPAQLPLRMSSAFPDARGAVEDTQGSCMMEKRLQRKFEWADLPAVLAEGLLRLNRDARRCDEAPCSVPYSFDLLYVWINAARRRGEIEQSAALPHLDYCNNTPGSDEHGPRF